MERSERAHKILLYRWVTNFLRGKEYEVALDLACGQMKFADIINAKRYVGVDIDAERLAKAAESKPRAEAIASSIEDLPPDLKGDLVLCLQCIGINDLFEAERGLEVVRKIIAATKPRGVLVFNIGRGCRAQYDDIHEAVRGAFESAQRIQYGRFWERRPSAYARLLGQRDASLPIVGEVIVPADEPLFLRRKESRKFAPRRSAYGGKSGRGWRSTLRGCP